MTRIGLIGAGKIAENAHLPILSAHPGVRIEWIFDPNASRARDMAQLYQTRACTTPTYSDVDLVVIATPVGVRQAYIDSSAANGCAVFLEKPIAMTLDAHRAILRQFPAHACALGFQRRFYPQVEQLRTLISSSWFGALRSMQVRQGYFNLKSGGAQHFTQNTALSGGGLLVESAIHIVDSALYACAVQEVELQHRNAIAHGRLDFHMRLVGTARTATAQTLALTIETSTLQNLPSNGVLLGFDNAQVFWSGDPSRAIEIRALESTSPEAAQNSSSQSLVFAKSSINAAFLACWQAVLQALDSKTPNASSACTSLATTALIELAYDGL